MCPCADDPPGGAAGTARFAGSVRERVGCGRGRDEELSGREEGRERWAEEGDTSSGVKGLL